MARRRDFDRELRPRRPRGPIPNVPDVPDVPDLPDAPQPPDSPKAQITSVEELLDLAGRTASRGAPLVEEVTAPGMLAPDLRGRLDAQEPRTVLSGQQLKRLAQLARDAGPVDFGVGRAAALEPLELPPGGYDLTIALRIRAASEVLATLYEEGALSHEIDSIFFDLDALRTAFEGVPDGDDIQIGTMHVNTAPSLSAVSDGEVGVLRLPFTLDLDRDASGEEPVTTLDGILQLGVKPDASVGDRLMSVWLDAADLPEGVPLFEIASSSPLQPRSAEALRDFAEPLKERFKGGLDLELGTARWSVCPEIRLPVGPDLELRVQRVDIRVRTDEHGGMLVVGVLIGPEAEPEEGSGDPEKLRSPSMPDAADVWARVDEALLYKVVRQAFEGGELQRAVDEEVGGDFEVVVKDAGVDVESSVAKIRLDVEAIDVCTGVKNVAARVTREVRVDVLDGRVTIKQTTHIDKDNSDTFLCGVSAALELLLAALVPPLFPSRLLYYTGLVANASVGGGPARAFVSGLIDPGVPLPGTEVLPSVEVLQASITNSGIETNGDLLLRRDDVNTYLHVKIVQRTGTSTPEPVRGVQVEVIDQDAPVPSSDDATVPPDTEIVSKKRIVETTHRLLPPDEDQVIDSGTTDGDGNLRLRLSPDQLATTAGTVETTTRTELLDVRGGPGVGGPDRVQTNTSRGPLREARPDIYFRLTTPDGRVVDTRDMEDGYFPNLRSKRLGTPKEPLTFVI